jgi:hypothetical protein
MQTGTEEEPALSAREGIALPSMDAYAYRPTSPAQERTPSPGPATTI